MVNNQELTPLHTAVSSSTNSRDTIALLRSGADVNARASQRMARTSLYWATPLHMAVTYNRNPKVIDALLNFGSDVNAFDKEGFTPLMRATTRRNGKVIKKFEIITALLKAGAKVNVWNKSGDTALHLAILRYSKIEVIKILLDAGASVNAWNRDKNTPLHFAVQGDTTLEVINTLIRAGAEVNIQNNHKETPLHEAVKTPSRFTMRVAETHEIINALIGAWADVNILNYDGYTPLHKTIKENTNNEIIKVLLDAGADVNASGKGDTPLHCAITAPSYDNKRSRRLGFSTCNNPNDFCEGCEVDVIKILLNAGADVNAIDWRGKTPLFLATEKIKDKKPSPEINQVLEVIELLNDAGSKLFSPNLLKKVSKLGLSARATICLRNESIVYIGDLVQKTEGEMLRIPNLGRKSLYEIKEVLTGMSLHLGMDITDWSPPIYK